MMSCDLFMVRYVSRWEGGGVWEVECNGGGILYVNCIEGLIGLEEFRMIEEW